MAWTRTILDGILLCLVFNLTVAVTWIFIPGAFSKMLPKEIRLAAPPRKKKEVIILASVLYPLYILIFAYMIVSAHLAGVTGFWRLFWTGYIEMFFINLGDFFGLDWWYRGAIKDKIMIPGTEHCKAWERKEWLLKLAIPEHALGWTFLVCPIAGLIVAGIAALLR